jgi:epoxyqueuosine reductase
MSLPVQSSPDIVQDIRGEALRLGFFKIGIAAAGPLPRTEAFDTWLSRGMHGTMEYMQRQAERRRNPRLLLGDVRTILVLAMSYETGRGLTNEPLRGRISRYAWGQDYHDLIKSRLKQLRGFIEHIAPGARCLEYVDTGPVMEKVWGAQTILGWTGKHSNLIARDGGSWFFVGVILTNLELPADQPERDYCGTCIRCISACPTRAIVAPYVVDARLCISYLTIELRGPIPRPLRRLIGNRIFGCDDCQEVCPWNRFAVRSPEAGFEPRNGNWMPELCALIRITPEEFNQRFKGSPVRRAKRDGFVRNVAVALGNSGSPEAISALASALRDRSPLVRAHAAWALGRIPAAAAIAELRRALGTEQDPSVLEELRLECGSEAPQAPAGSHAPRVPPVFEE